MSKTILIIDDEESICWGLSQLCKQMSFEAVTASSVEMGLEMIRNTRPDAILMDVRLPGMNGLDAIEVFKQQLGEVPIIIMTAFGDLQTAITAIQHGAYEYVVKPFELSYVRKVLEQALATPAIAESPSPAADQTITGLVGSSTVMQEVFKQIALTTTNDSPVLVTGESGTGKELTARAIHRFSERSSGPFVVANVTAMDPAVAEKELFGYGDENDPGDDSNRSGLLHRAGGGTLFLDEVADIPLELQIKLQQALELGEYLPVGGTVPVPTDFRLISATRFDLPDRINRGKFRHDLFYLIRSFEIRLPPLRQRKEDIQELAEQFLSHFHSEQPLSLSTEFVQALTQRKWSGNVRELRNVIEHAAILARGGVLLPSHLVEESIATRSVPARLSEGATMEELEAEISALVVDWTRQKLTEGDQLLYDQLLEVVELPLFEVAMKESGNQYASAARRLGLHRTTLKKKLELLRKHRNTRQKG